MSEKKQIDWGKVAINTLLVLTFVAFNAATIFFIVANMIPVGNDDNGASYWDLITVKFVAKELYGKDYLDYYRIWKKPVVYACMVLGWALTSGGLYGILKRKKDEKQQEKMMEKQSELTDKKIEKLADKLMRGMN